MCYHGDDAKLSEDLFKKLENYYTIQTPADVEEKNKEQMKNSKLFVCYLSSSFLNDTNCMNLFNFALNLPIRIVLLRNEINKFQLSFLENGLTNRLDIHKVNYNGNKNENSKVKKRISLFLR
jgi:hypothetical protein